MLLAQQDRKMDAEHSTQETHECVEYTRVTCACMYVSVPEDKQPMQVHMSHDTQPIRTLPEKHCSGPDSVSPGLAPEARNSTREIAQRRCFL